MNFAKFGWLTTFSQSRLPFLKSIHFFHFSNPMPESAPLYFKTSDSSHYNFFNVTNDGIFMQEDPNHDRMEFWNNIFNEFKHLWNTTFDFNLWTSVWASPTSPMSNDSTRRNMKASVNVVHIFQWRKKKKTSWK